MDPLWIGIISVVLMLLLLAIGVPISFALGLSGVISIAVLRDFDAVLTFMETAPFTAVSNWALVIIPLFILMGAFAYSAGITEQAYELGNKFLGHIHGGIAMATIFGAALFAATSGSSIATAAAMCKISMPEMRKLSYSDKLSAGCVAAGGTLGILIPPSGTMVVFGILTETSITKLLVAGILPGIMSALVYMIGIYVMARFFNMGGLLQNPVPWKERIFALRKGMGVVILFLGVMGSIYTGIATVVEAAGVGAMIAFIMLLTGSKQRWTDLSEAIKSCATGSCMILTVFVGASAFALNLTMSHIPQEVSKFLIGLNMSPELTVALILIPYIPLGMFLDPISMMVLTLPILYPVVETLGFSGIWFGILVTKLIEISLLTPPVGLNLYVVKATQPDLSLKTIILGSLPFVLMDFFSLSIIFLFPKLSLFLPELMK